MIYNHLKEAVEEAFPKCQVIMGSRSGISAKHGCHKISLRFWVRGAGYYKSTMHCGQEVLKKINPLLIAKGLPELLDTQAYKRNQKLGVVTHTKLGDTRVLKIKTKGIAPELTLVQNIEGEEFITVKMDKKIMNSRTIVKDCEGIVLDILNATKKLMPEIEYESYKESPKFHIIAFQKSQDECPLHNTVHKGNRAYAIWYPDTGTASPSAAGCELSSRAVRC